METKDMDETLLPLAGIALFDSDAGNTINTRLSLKTLIAAASNYGFAAYLRQRIAMAAWVRAILLHDTGLRGRSHPAVQKPDA